MWEKSCLTKASKIIAPLRNSPDSVINTLALRVTPVLVGLIPVPRYRVASELTSPLI